eukprot:TRINITY_DN14557_c0_g1_i1.p1 TRINITY_DN14557_c0_g1~~TRINITY_DN14557_c0_g1_i1.p1  ORF type:complete len:1315 (+),score=335.24 TRINITY_DN14557_c0_g1_i1:93-4037(+)
MDFRTTSPRAAEPDRADLTATAETMEGLQSSAKLVQQQQNRDEHVPDLLDLLSNTSPNGDYMTQALFDPRLISTLRLPEALLEQYNHLECKCFMGLFPEINRAWVTIDNKIFLWNYNDGADFCMYDGLDQIIVSAGLVRCKPNVFVEEIQHVLILATPVEIVMLGVQFRGGSPQNEMILYPTNMTLPTDNINMLKIAGTDNGRVFMCGRDGNLYELLYQPEDGWIRRKCRKVNRSQSLLGSMWPSFLRFSTEDPIVDIAVDNPRHCLYTLSQTGIIQVYDLGVDLQGMSKGPTCRTVSKDMARITNDTYWETQKVDIVALAPVSTFESRKVQLVAITSLGIRLYFSVTPGDVATGSKLVLLRVLQPPMSDRTMTTPSQPGSPTSPRRVMPRRDVHSAFYSGGVVLLADSRSETKDCLVGTGPDMTHAADRGSQYGQRLGLVEAVSTVEIDGKAWALSETPLSVFFAHPGLSKQLETTLGNELATQFLLPARRFLCITNTGLQNMVKLRPVDQLRYSLMQNEAQIESFMHRYNRDETCAMLLSIACSTAYSVSSRSQTGTMSSSAADSEVVTQAQRVFFRYGGQPQYEKPQASIGSTYGMGRAVFTPDLKYSGKHQGFVLYLSRLLRPVWQCTVTICSAKDVLTNQKGRFSNDELLFLSRPLSALRAFCERFQNFIPQAAGAWDRTQVINVRQRLLELQSRKQPEEALREEQLSLLSMFQLLVRALEALVVLEVLNDAHLPRLTAAENAEFKAEWRTRLSKLTFRELVASEEGRAVSTELIRSMLAFLSNDKPAVETISNALRSRAPSFFSGVDLQLVRAADLVRGASNMPASHQRDELLGDALKIYKQVARHVPLQQVCTTFLELGFVVGIVDLALLRANEEDPSGLAVSAARTAMNEVEDARVKIAVERRMSCYQVLLDTLTCLVGLQPARLPFADSERSRLFELMCTRALTSTDELFHVVLYRWCILNNLTEYLLKMQSPFLEAFLQREARQDPHKDLLWKFYVHNEKYAPACHILSTLADDKTSRFSLEKRIEYLSLAIGMAKSCVGPSQGGVDGEFLHELQDKLDVARIQLQTYQELRGMLGVAGPEGAHSEIARAVEELDLQLYSVSELYNKFANHFNLWEVSLAIVNCAGHDDQALIRRLWDKIIQKDAGDLGHLAEKIRQLGRLYYPNESIFPVSYIVDLLERQSVGVQTRMDTMWVVSALREVGVPYYIIFMHYHSAMESIDPIWQTPTAQVHLLGVIARLLREWLAYMESTHVTRHEIQQFRTQARDVHLAVNSYITLLHANAIPQAQRLTEELKSTLRHKLLQI